MVRTSDGTVRISGGKSSKKGAGGGNRSTPSKSTNRSSSSKGGARLIPITQRETPTWQKPITNFFNAECSTSNKTSEVCNTDIDGDARNTDRKSIKSKEGEEDSDKNDRN